MNGSRHPLQDWCKQRTVSLIAASDYLLAPYRFVTPSTVVAWCMDGFADA